MEVGAEHNKSRLNVKQPKGSKNRLTVAVALKPGAYLPVNFFTVYSLLSLIVRY